MMKRLAISAFLILSFSAGTAFAWTEGIPDKLKQSLYPAVLDAGWGVEGRSIWLFVLDNGENRDGLAIAACGSLEYFDEVPAGQRISVRIFDAAKAMNEVGEELGSARCRAK